MSRLFYIIVLIFISASLPARSQTSLEKTAEAGPPVWRIDGEKRTVWLIASLHYLGQDTKWRSPAVADALDNAEVFWFEADSGSDAAIKAAETALAESGANKTGVTLSSLLGPRTAPSLAHAATTLQIPAAALEPMRPWRAHLVIGMQMITNAGYEPGKSLTALVKEEASTRARKTRYLESAEVQLATLTSLKEKTELSLLRAGLKNFDDMRANLPALLTAWRTGDVDDVNALLNEPLRISAPLAYDALVVKRNAAWSTTIKDIANGRNDAVVVVSARHLVGADSIVEMLREGGIEIERM